MYRQIEIRKNPNYKYDEVLTDINYNFSLITGSSSSFSGGTVSGTTNFLGQILSGGTDLYDIFSATSGVVDITRVQPGTNIITGGTDNFPIINLVSSPSINGLLVSGTSNFSGIIQSGGTDLYNIFSTAVFNEYWTAGTALNSVVSINQLHFASGQNSLVAGGQNNSATTINSAIIGGQNNLVSGERSIVLGGQNIDASSNDTVYVPHLNISSLSSTTSSTTYSNVVVDLSGNVLINNLFYIGVNFEVTGVTWNYIAPEVFSINSIDNPNSISYSLLHNNTGYTLGNVINLYDTFSITGVTQVGFLKLNSELW